MIRIRTLGLGKRFGDRVAVEGLSFEVHAGEVFGLLGPNGAGKTTTVRMLTGLLRPSEGSAEVCGLPLSAEGFSGASGGASGGAWGTEIRSKVGLLTETPGLYDRLTARENLSFFVKLHALEPEAAWRRAKGYLERLGLGGREEDAVGGWSKGMRQKLAFVRTLLHEPEVVFLDEPTSGLDPDSARIVRDEVATYAAGGRAVVLCSHNLPEVERLCNRVGVVQGRLLGMGAVAELRQGGLSLEIRLAEAGPSMIPRLLGGVPGVSAVRIDGPVLKMALDREERASEVVAELVRAGARLLSVVPHRRTLEEAYLEMTRAGGGVS